MLLILKKFVSRKVNESEKKEILNLFKKGTNIKEISKIYNFTIPTITRQLKTLMGDQEFLKFKNSNLIGTDSEKKKFKSLNRKKLDSNINLEINNFLEDKNSKIENNNYKLINNKENSSENSLFVELPPIECEIENSKQKDLTSVSISEINFPKLVYMIVDHKIELEIKLLKEYPEWHFLSPEDLNRKTIKIYDDLKLAKRDCNKDQKVIRVPNTNVFKIVSSILISRGISRIVTSDKLIALV